ncbi:uncharacterized protein LOC116179984 [Photinus pyralis]|uniref:uncharacterized protein LOC116160127 n=1 Tax=Photinus pyralis TaxID=7054 RepID=UPI001266F200|nr:uncharacterized protein LOC116160127 [Photinus pyralis]XP_031355667.1 uncharacterized protein LOC116179984 [Photinus pyralis]
MSSSLTRKMKKPKINKVNILSSMLIKPQACTTNKAEKKTTKPSTSLVQQPPTNINNNNWQSCALTQMEPLDEVITIHSDNSTITTGHLGENLELDLLLAQLEGDPATNYLFEPARIIPTPQLTEPQRSPTPPPPQLPLTTRVPPPPPKLSLPPSILLSPPPPPPPPAEPVVPSGQKRPRCHDNASRSPSDKKKKGKNLADVVVMIESDLEEGYFPETPTQQDGSLHPKTPRELALTTYGTLKNMEPVYRAKLLDARNKTTELQRQLETAKKEERRLEKEVAYIEDFLKFVKPKK